MRFGRMADAPGGDGTGGDERERQSDAETKHQRETESDLFHL
jgi:hypothetical protein